MRCSDCIHLQICKYPDDDGCKLFMKERPHGNWDGEPENHNLYTRICSSCGGRGVVGYFCMWCGADMKKEGEEE